MSKRSRYASKGWWAYQVRRLKAAIAAIPGVVSCWYQKRFPKPLTDQEQWDQWQLDIERIQTHITEALRHRVLFREIGEMLVTHPTLRTSTDAGYVYEWLRDLYAHYITMAVRRELDTSSEVFSLRQLLYQISNRPTALTRDRFRQHWRDQTTNYWDKPFDDLAGTGAYIDPTIVKHDMRQLAKRARFVKLFADRIVAHRTEQQIKLTVKHVDRSLDSLEQTLQKYYLLLTGRTLLEAEPAIVHTWRLAFRVPWDH